MCLVLKIILMLYWFSVRLNFLETRFTHGLRRLLSLELLVESVKLWG
jgi:hypothetical protein